MYSLIYHKSIEIMAGDDGDDDDDVVYATVGTNKEIG